MIDLRNQDCMEFLKSLEDRSIDLILIDPPYVDCDKIKDITEYKKTKKNKVITGYSENELDVNKIMHLADRKLKNGGSFIIFGNQKTLLKWAKYTSNIRDEGIILKNFATNALSANVSLMHRVEFFVVIRKQGAATTFNKLYKEDGKLQTNVFEVNAIIKGRIHPSQKPLAVIESLIKIYSNKCDTVCDFFSGSGTTAVAAANTGRNFVGCELDKKYYEDSIARIKKEVKDGELLQCDCVS